MEAQLQQLQDRITKLEARLEKFDFPERFSMHKNIILLDGRSIQVGGTNGTRIGTSASQKLGFFGKTPVGQQGAISTPNSPGTTYNQTDATTLKTAIDAIRTALTNLGLTQ